MSPSSEALGMMSENTTSHEPTFDIPVHLKVMIFIWVFFAIAVDARFVLLSLVLSLTSLTAVAPDDGVMFLPVLLMTLIAAEKCQNYFSNLQAVQYLVSFAWTAPLVSVLAVVHPVFTIQATFLSTSLQAS